MWGPAAFGCPAKPALNAVEGAKVSALIHETEPLSGLDYFIAFPAIPS